MEETAMFLAKRLDACEPAMAWRPGSLEEMSTWQIRARSEILSLIGGMAHDRSPLEPESEPGPDGFERVRFGSLPGLRASGYFLKPEGEGRVPAMICIPGHGAGVRAIIGLDEEAYQANLALQCRDHGFAVLALEPISFGTRTSERVGPSGSSCDADAKTALMLGETLAGWRIAEARRAVDYLLKRPEVDPARIGIMGISGGGMIALWTAALDPRIAAAVVSGYFCTFRESILAVDHCLDNFVPGMLKVMEMPDLAGLVAPRALFVESGTEDSIFPIEGFRKAVARANEIFDGFGAPDNFGSEEFPGGHRFHGEGAFKFLRRQFAMD